MKIFTPYLKTLTSSPVLNAKLLLLTKGLDFDFLSIRKTYPKLKEKYKVNKIRVSDRHFISPKSIERDLIPDELILKEGNQKSVVKVYFKKDSPFLFSLENNEFVILDKKSKEKFPINIKPVPLYNYSKKLHKGIPLDEFVNVVGLDRISIIPFDSCEHWVHGEQCQFCGANPRRMGFTGIKPNVFEIKNKFNGDHKAWWNHHRDYMRKSVSKSFEALLKDKIKPHFHFAAISGNLLDLDFEWEITFDLVNAIKDMIDFSQIDSYFNLMPPLNFEKKIKKAHEYGFRYICFNLECFDKQIFKKVCPGKYKIYGYNKMIEALKYGVNIFGKGRARTNFVLGSEPIEGLIKGALKLAKEGVVPDYTIFFPRSGSLWAKREVPSPEDILYFTKELVKIHKEYNFKPFCCSLSSRSSIANEVYNYL
jgi:hypothetical protein